MKTKKSKNTIIAVDTWSGLTNWAIGYDENGNAVEWNWDDENDENGIKKTDGDEFEDDNGTIWEVVKGAWEEKKE